MVDQSLVLSEKGNQIVVDAQDGHRFYFDTWTGVVQFAERRARAENVPESAFCTTCYDGGCGESDGDGIMSPRVRKCDGDCGDGCKTSRPVADCGDNCPCRKQDWKGG